MIRMNWYDFTHSQFMHNGVEYSLGKGKCLLRRRLLFILNLFRERFVTLNDLIEFVYADMPLCEWPDYQNGCVRTTVLNLRRLLPEGVTIISSYGFGYMLTESENK